MAKYVFSKDILNKYSLSYSRLNHYTEMGLLPTVSRSGNKRVYERKVVEKRIPLIQKLTAEGYPLSIIRKILLKEGQATVPALK